MIKSRRSKLRIQLHRAPRSLKLISMMRAVKQAALLRRWLCYRILSRYWTFLRLRFIRRSRIIIVLAWTVSRYSSRKDNLRCSVMLTSSPLRVKAWRRWMIWILTTLRRVTTSQRPHPWSWPSNKIGRDRWIPLVLNWTNNLAPSLKSNIRPRWSTSTQALLQSRVQRRLRSASASKCPS